MPKTIKEFCLQVWRLVEVAHTLIWILAGAGGAMAIITALLTHAGITTIFIGAVIGVALGVVVAVAWAAIMDFKKPPFRVEVYRVASSPKSPVGGLVRELYKRAGRENKFSIDVDILVEMYIVNASKTSRYIRDIEATFEVDGKWVPLLRQRDFRAWEFSGQNFEYCLNGNADGMEQCALETLTNLSDHVDTGTEIRPERPIEGWVRFVAEGIDPEKLGPNPNFRFSIVDSLGRSNSIVNGSTPKRRGEIDVRMIPMR